ncbi:MAG: flagellar basal body rod protein FlgC [Firmicutes bacterium HGW-Firmicutes-16]|nr:MAG: flagellar basal body rod protein FlgC [Firmicutes bacterium HGW-Firmicutes-16]
MSFSSSLDIVGSALTAERFRTDIITQNIANAQTTKTANGEPYRRQMVEFEEIPLAFSEELDKAKSGGGVRVSNVVKSDAEFKLIYDPTNPDANAEGYVQSSNVDTTEEQVDLLAASNAYEANLTALSVVKAMINRTIEMGNK